MQNISMQPSEDDMIQIGANIMIRYRNYLWKGAPTKTYFWNCVPAHAGSDIVYNFYFLFLSHW